MERVDLNALKRLGVKPLHLQQLLGFGCADGGEDVIGGDFLAGFEEKRRRPPLAFDDLADAALHPAFAAGLAVFFEQDPQNHPHAFERPRESLEKERLEHDDELAEIHVVLLGAAVIHQRAEQHGFEQWIRHVRPHDFAGRHRWSIERHIIVGFDGCDQLAETLGLGGEFSGHFVFQYREIVRETQRGLAARTEGNAGLFLFAQRKFVALDPQLAEKFAQRRAFDPGPDVIGHRMETHVEFPARNAVETIEPADRVVPFEDAHPFPEVREPDAGGETGHAGTDDGDVVVRSGVHGRLRISEECSRKNMELRKSGKIERTEWFSSQDRNPCPEFLIAIFMFSEPP